MTATSSLQQRGRITVGELAIEYRDARVDQVSVRAWESDESALRVHIEPTFGRLPLSSVTPVPIERVLANIASTRSVRTAARIRTTLRGLFDYAVQTRRIRASTAVSVKLPRPDSRTDRVVQIGPFTLDVLLPVVGAQRQVAGGYADLTLVLGLTSLRLVSCVGSVSVISSLCPTRPWR